MWTACALTLGVLLLSASAASTTPSPTTKQQNQSFVTVENGQFMRDGSPFKFVGTNAYWLANLADDDIKGALQNFSDLGIKVVRTWGFNDVETPPTDGSLWFQSVQNGTTVINNGTDGLQRLDKVVQYAEEVGILLMMTLTNNWNPTPSGTDSFPRNFLSNAYGGMDVYVRQLATSQTHDEFYTNATLIQAFLEYTTEVVTRYVNSTAIFAWELANDPRCNSTLPASETCNTMTITRWYDLVAAHVSSLDTNHLVGSGSHGFLCTDCPKLYPPPAPQISSSSGQKKRALGPIRERYMREPAEKRKRDWKARQLDNPEAFMTFRGRWIAPRQASPGGLTQAPAYDGSHGVDSEDILNIPNIGFGTYQLFPDQNSYGMVGQVSSGFNGTIEQAATWINQQIQTATLAGKPTILTAFGLLTEDNAPFFVPFNSSALKYPSTATSQGQAAQSSVASAAQQSQAYFNWTALATGLDDTLVSVPLTARASTAVSAAAGGLQYQATSGNSTQVPAGRSNPVPGGSGQVGKTPNDGYGNSTQVLAGLLAAFGHLLESLA